MIGRGLSKAGVDKDPVISSFLVDPILGLILIFKILQIFGRSYLINGKELFNIYFGIGLSKAGVGSCNMAFLTEPQV